LAACVLAVDPAGLGLCHVRAAAGPVRDRWLGLLAERMPADAPLRRMPAGMAPERLLGGLDLAATLAAGRPVAETGLLGEAHGGMLVVAMAERLPRLSASHLATALDHGEVLVERDGLALRRPARLGVVLLDEGDAAAEPPEQPPANLLERAALTVVLAGVGVHAAVGSPYSVAEVEAARQRLAGVSADDETVGALCEAAVVLGIASPRAPLLALRAARALAALAGRTSVGAEEAAAAARLVLAPRATQLPSVEPEAPPAEPPPPQQREADEPSAREDEPQAEREMPPLGEIVVASAAANLPMALLDMLSGAVPMRAKGPAGRAGKAAQGNARGRRIGARRGDPRRERLDLLATLRAAAPWQRLRKAPLGLTAAPLQPPLAIRREDFRVPRTRQKQRTTTIFVVDASGSAAMHRLAEAKGAVELLLGECYIRRDEVALIAFRDRKAELLLPPTRSLPRAKASLAALPGGGGTPLATAIDLARLQGGAVRRAGHAPILVFLTDGQGNIARDGSPGRVQAEADALAAAAALAADGLDALLIDASPRGQAKAQRLARAMNGRYLALPQARASGVLEAVRAVQGQPGKRG
jgi:magnesium chelatase subunit D